MTEEDAEKVCPAAKELDATQLHVLLTAQEKVKEQGEVKVSIGKGD